MNFLQATLLGLLQGITEFLPISSSGHLVVAESLLGLEVSGLKDFDIALHTATLLAILIYFRHDLLKTAWWPWLVLGSIPAALVGFTLEDKIDATFRNAETVGVLMILMGVLFLIPQKMNNKPLTWWRGLLMGCGQALAIIPGVSRSGATIFTGMHLGMTREEAARFSFLLGGIAIAGAGLLKALDTESLEFSWSVLSVGFFASFFSSLLAVSWLMKFLKNHSFRAFGWYRIAFGVLILISLHSINQAESGANSLTELTLIAATDGDGIENGTSPIYLIDEDKKVVHEWTVEGENQIFARLQEYDKTLIYRAETATQPNETNESSSVAFISKIDWEGEQLWKYENPLIHHDFLELPNGNMLFTIWEPYEGEAQKNFWADTLVEWNPITEQVVWEWRAAEHLDLNTENRREGGSDLTHFNGIDYVNGEILVSSHVLKTVFIIEQTSGQITWQSRKGLFDGQHDPSFLENGNILVFSNQAKLESSKVVELDRETQETVWSYSAPGFFSGKISGAQRLPSGNTLITEGETGTIFEVTPEGQTVWEYQVPGKVFKAFRYELAIDR